jgi:hypothetical protein
MLHSDNFLPRYDAFATMTVAINCKRSRHLSGQLLLAAALVALPVSTSIAKGQTSKPQNDTSAANVHPEVCEGQTPDNHHNLSTGSGTASGVTEEQEATHFDSASAPESLRLPGVENSTGAADQYGAQCKRPHNDTPKQSQPRGPAGANQPVHPQADSTAPIVTYSGGQLKVVGHGARLEQILETIKELTGITLEIPQDSADNQIFDDVGPAPARQALMQLLDGTRLNYVILGSPGEPERVNGLILTAQTSTMPTTTSGSANGLPVEQASGPALYGAGFSETTGQATTIEPAANTGTPAPVNTNMPVNPTVQQESNATGKTPGQILDELQKKQLQQLDAQAAQSAPQ